MHLVETEEPPQRVGLFRREPGSVFVSAHCSACGRVYPARESDVEAARRHQAEPE